MNKQLWQSILISYLIGAPIGILTIIATIIIPVLYSREGISSMSIIMGYGFPTLGLIAAFIIALWFGGKLAYKNVNKGKSLILTSFKYSTFVNLIIWTTYCLIVYQTIEDDSFKYMLPAIIVFLISTILSTFTIGLLISYIIKLINRSN
jgi:biotin transporter BioY